MLGASSNHNLPPAIKKAGVSSLLPTRRLGYPPRIYGMIKFNCSAVCSGQWTLESVQGEVCDVQCALLNEYMLFWPSWSLSFHPGKTGLRKTNSFPTVPLFPTFAFAARKNCGIRPENVEC